jgi:hypothetical protein
MQKSITLSEVSTPPAKSSIFDIGLGTKSIFSIHVPWDWENKSIQNHSKVRLKLLSSVFWKLLDDKSCMQYGKMKFSQFNVLFCNLFYYYLIQIRFPILFGLGLGYVTKFLILLEWDPQNCFQQASCKLRMEENDKYRYTVHVHLYRQLKIKSHLIV